MVENQHGISSFLSFGAKSVNPKILESLLVGRQKNVNQLENRIKNIVLDGLNHQILIVGARGTGKTHILRVLYYRLQPFISQKKLIVAYFAEEEYGISGYLDFMVRILNAFIRWNDEDAEFLKEKLTILQETPSVHQEDTIERIIRDYIGEKPLLILAENFNDILSALKKESQSKLRSWLYKNERISIIATSQALSDDIGKEDRPFYGFFDEILLKPLSLEESFQLLKSLAKIENREDVIKHLENKGKAQVKAINTLVKGNHRLLITFYEFLKSDILSNLSIMFIKTLNDLKPYYETYIRFLPPQQQKILRFIALSKIPQKGTTIARECFIEQKSLSKQLSELSRKKLIEIIVNSEDKRNRLYDIAEPLLRISIEIGEQREGINALFIDFLALYYNQNELQDQRSRFSELLNSCQDPKEKRLFSYEIIARERALMVQEQTPRYQNKISQETLKQVVEFINRKDLKKALSLMLNIPRNSEIKFVLLGRIYSGLNQFEDALRAYKQASAINPMSGDIRVFLGEVYFRLDDYELAIEALLKAVDINSHDENSWRLLGHIYFKTKQFEEAINSYSRATEIDSNIEGNWFNLGIVYAYIGQVENAKNTFKKTIELNPLHIGANWSLSLNYLQMELPKKALLIWHKLISIGTMDTVVAEELLLDIISQAVINILKYDKKLTVETCLQIEKSLFEDYGNPKDLKISLLFLQIFRKVVLQNQEKALYELTKEQREFFVKEILDFRKK